MTASPAAAATPHPLTGYVLAAAGAVLFSSKGVLIKLAYAENVDAITLLTLRMLISVPIFAAVGFATFLRGRSAGAPPVSWRDILLAALAGQLGYWFASYTDFKGLETLSPQFERLILFTYPLFVVLFGAAFFGLPFRRRSLAAFAVSYAGLMLIFLTDVSTHGAAVAVGAAWVLSSAVAFALYQLFAKPLIGRLGAPLFTSVSMSAAAFGVVGQFLATRPLTDLAVSPWAFQVAVMVAIGATVLPTYVMNAALSKISAQANAVIGTLSPVVTLVLAVLILGETVTPADLAGTVLVLGGIGLFTLFDRRGRQ
jgi:drug/metabolite transporter (DMT)-like permease